MPAAELVEVTWGNVRLWCGRISTDNSRTQVVHELAEGDEHPVQDRGRAPRRVTCSLLFVDMPGETQTPIERFKVFKAQVDSGEEQLFSHPIDGAYLAKVGQFNYTIDEDSNVVDASCEFIASGEIRPIVPAGAGTSSRAGEDALAARAEDLEAANAAAGIESTLPADAVAAQAGWQDAEEAPTRQVIVDVASLSDSLSTFIDDQLLEYDLELWDVYRATIMLGSSVRAAASAQLSEVANVFRVRIAVPQSLLGLCARIYGGAEAEDRTRQVLALNDIRRAGWLDPGLELVMPATFSRRRIVA